ncbi:AimR family lysis-lysogeny pheromone receptor [Alkalihalobacillus pseudalcaliphilus]|uniref:AimR family lysis-lysogeny pheromone receptor n=1 Tax=Alkalihalobacillus pseudalcaliphilus TaxID=79884 RepID=UPI00064E0817|nr:AimR family lysis-lysogeny pheromone receptor [Alkalihalobacillus pseudalcaliphilus]KMK75415.1 hypothetical protein AB990_08845 [Alkalihalobacillus pseudalcaliphilus]
MKANEIVKELMKENGLNQTNVADLAGIQSKSVVSKFLTGSVTTDLSNVILIARSISPDRFIEITNQYIQEINKPQQVQNALEYAFTFNQVEVLDFLCSKFEGSRDVDDWVDVYSIAKDMLSADCDLVTLIDRLKEVYGQIKTQELKCSANLFEAYAYYKLNDDDRVEHLVSFAGTILSELKEGYLKESLLVRYNTLITLTSLYVKEDITKVKQAVKGITQSKYASDLSVASAYHSLAAAVTFVNLDEAILYYNKAVSLYDYLGRDYYVDRILKSDIPFAYNLHKKEFDTDGIDIEELAHYYVQRGENEVALDLLEGVKSLSVFGEFYKAKAGKDLLGLFEVQIKFSNYGFSFYTNLIKEAIKSL